LPRRQQHRIAFRGRRCASLLLPLTPDQGHKSYSKKELWVNRQQLPWNRRLGQIHSLHPNCLPKLSIGITMLSTIQLSRIHQLPSSVRQIITRNSNCTTIPLNATRQLSHAATRPQLGAFAAVRVPQQQRSITIKQLDTGRDGEWSHSQLSEYQDI
jgi:hypothetical protein